MSELLCPRFQKISNIVVFLLRMLAIHGVSLNYKVAFLIFFRDFDSHTDAIFIYVFTMHSRKGIHCA